MAPNRAFFPQRALDVWLAEAKIDFTGREYVPLMLKPGDKPGVNLRVAPEQDEPASGPQGQQEVAK